jgi:hypothetical protein
VAVLKRGDRPEKALSRPHGQAEPPQVVIAEIGQIGNLDLLDLERSGVFTETMLFEPVTNAGHS